MIFKYLAEIYLHMHSNKIIVFNIYNDCSSAAQHWRGGSTFDSFFKVNEKSEHSLATCRSKSSIDT